MLQITSNYKWPQASSVSNGLEILAACYSPGMLQEVFPVQYVPLNDKLKAQ